FFREHRAALLEVVDDEAVVHDFVAHVDRSAQRLDRALDDLDRAVDAGAESAGIGEYDFHPIILPRRGYRRARESRLSRPRSVRRTVTAREDVATVGLLVAGHIHVWVSGAVCGVAVADFEVDGRAVAAVHELVRVGIASTEARDHAWA